MEGRRNDLFGGGSATGPLPATSDLLPRHAGLTREPAASAAEAMPETVAAAPMTSDPSRIGQLRYVEPRDLWPTGEAELLAWLAKNPDPLAVATGLELRPLADGAPGPDDSLVLETTAGDRVVVVVDLGESSDNALGRMMRTVAATGAKAAIWAVGTGRKEHIASLSWLNRTVAERSFIVQLRAARIDDSRPAPLFGPMLRPPRHDDKPTTAPPPDSAPDAEFGRRADDWPSVSLIERGAEEPA